MGALFGKGVFVLTIQRTQLLLLAIVEETKSQASATMEVGCEIASNNLCANIISSLIILYANSFCVLDSVL